MLLSSPLISVLNMLKESLHEMKTHVKSYMYYCFDYHVTLVNFV